MGFAHQGHNPWLNLSSFDSDRSLSCSTLCRSSSVFQLSRSSLAFVIAATHGISNWFGSASNRTTFSKKSIFTCQSVCSVHPLHFLNALRLARDDTYLRTGCSPQSINCNCQLSQRCCLCDRSSGFQI
jgi:hypothetical protein